MAPLRTPGGIETDYDAIADVLLITFMDTIEPTYGHNVDDVVIVLRGTVSEIMIGLEILDAKRHGPEKIWKALSPVIQKEKHRIEERMRTFQSRIEELERRDLEDLVPA